MYNYLSILHYFKKYVKGIYNLDLGITILGNKKDQFLKLVN